MIMQMPRSASRGGAPPAQPDKVSVTGPAEKVEECIDHMLLMEEEILQELAEREDVEVFRPPKSGFSDRKDNRKAKSVNKMIKLELRSGFEIRSEIRTLLTMSNILMRINYT